MDKENVAKLEAFRQKMEAMKEAAGTTTEAVDITESKAELSESGVLLKEADDDSSIRTIKVIQPGWNKGNVRFYPKEVLERDAGVFHAGLLMFKNHQTDQEAATRPEGSLDDLSAVFVENAKFDANGPDGEGVYAKVKVFSGFKETLDEIAPYIGVSIRASGTGFQGEADGHKGMVIESLDVARSVDFVTLPGAGGKVVQMFESATPPESVVIPKATEAKKEENMEVRETEEFKALEAERDKERAEKEKLQEAQLLVSAREHVTAEIGKSELPDITKARLVKETSANPPIKDGKLDTEALDQKVTEALKEAAAEIAALTGAGEIKDNGDTDATEADVKEQAAKLKESGTNLFGLSEQGAAIFAKGRG